MKTRFLLAALLLVSLLPACTQAQLQKAFATPQVVLRYDDFGPERIAMRLLGPRGGSSTVIAHHGRTMTAADGTHQVNVQQAMYWLRSHVRGLPLTAENETVRQRLRSTYSALYDLHRTRRDAIMSAPFSYGRAGMYRAMIVPPMSPSI